MPPSRSEAMFTVQSAPIDNVIRDREESLPRDQLEALQLARLREVVARVAHVPFYREAFELARHHAQVHANAWTICAGCPSPPRTT
jgi:phenylacetate-coenzyme A ligase PaaK-like adenylate-forming protein